MPRCQECDILLDIEEGKYLFYTDGDKDNAVPLCRTCLAGPQICMVCGDSFDPSDTSTKTTAEGIAVCSEECLNNLSSCWYCGLSIPTTGVEIGSTYSATCEYNIESPLAEGETNTPITVDYDLLRRFISMGTNREPSTLEEVKIIKRHREYCDRCVPQALLKCDCCGELANKSSFDYSALARAVKAGIFRKYPKVCIGCFNSQASRFKSYDVIKCVRCEDLYPKGEKGSTEEYCKRCYYSIPTCECCGEKTFSLSQSKIDKDTADQLSLHFSSNIYGDVKYRLCYKCTSGLATCFRCNGKTTKNNIIKGLFNSEESVCGNCVSIAEINNLTYSQCKCCLKFYQKTSADSPEHCSDCTSKYIEVHSCCDTAGCYDHRSYCRLNEPSVYNYTYKPEPLPFLYTSRDAKSKSLPIFMGFENEVTFWDSYDYMRDSLTHIFKTYNNSQIICKDDSSIDGHGFEIVSCPMTLDYLHSLDLSELFRYRPENCDSVGTHIHIDRRSIISDVHLFKIVNFIHDNEDFIDTLARRSYNEYNMELMNKPSTVVKKENRNDYGERHSRVNLTNSSTVEIRMFAGCTREFQLRYCMEFVHALVSWTGQCSIKGASLKGFSSYVNKNYRIYPNLFKLLTKHSTIGGMVTCA